MRKTAAALIVAGGKGKRMDAAIPKQFLPLNGTPMLIHALLPFEHHHGIDTIAVVLPRKYHAKGRQLVRKYGLKKVGTFALAGRTRQMSVHHGLEALKKVRPDLVVIHDAARPLVTQDLITRICALAKRKGAASAALAVTDTIVHKTNGKMIERKELLSMQTPQAFDYAMLCKAHAHALKNRKDDFPDDTSLVRAYGVQSVPVEGDATNLKITSKGDLYLAEAIIRSRAESKP